MSQDNDRQLFDRAMRALEAEIANAGMHMVWDATVRQAYAREIREMSLAVEQQVKAGKITWAEAAKEANKLRNDILEIMRTRSTPVGRAEAQRQKLTGKTLNELIVKKTAEKYPGFKFENLSTVQRNHVYAAIVKSSGKPKDKVNTAMQRLNSAGRGLVVLSVALSVYHVAMAEDKAQTIAREASIAGGGIAGGVAGGAAAGLVCGPAAPGCVAVGAFVGGALAAFGVSLFW